MPPQLSPALALNTHVPHGAESFVGDPRGVRMSGPALRPPSVYEYRVFIVHDGEEAIFSHFSNEKLWEGAVLRVNKPGAEIDRLSVSVHRVVSHPTDHGPGIAYGRGSD